MSALVVPALAVLLLGAAPTEARPRVGVIASGPDAAAAGVLQNDLETELSALSSVQLVPATSFAGSLGASAPEQTASDASDSLQQLESAYYEGKLDAARDRLAEAAAKLTPLSKANPSQAQRMLLWRVALELAKNDRVAAEADARTLVLLAPDVKVDLAVYPPAVQKALDDVRAGGIRPIMVDVTGHPANTEIAIDGVVVNVPAGVPAGGNHTFSVRAPGYRPVVNRPISGDSNKIVVSLAPIVPGNLDSIVNAADGANMQLPDSLRAITSVDVWVLATARGTKARGGIWKPAEASPVWRSSVIEEKQLGPAIARVLRDGVPGPHDATALVPEAGIEAVSLARTFKANGISQKVPLGGFGPAIGVRGEHGRFAGELHVGYASFGGSSLTYKQQGTSAPPTKSKINSFLQVRAAAGVKAVGPLWIQLGLFHQSYSGDDSYGIAPGFTRSGLVLEALARQPLAAGLSAELGLGISPVSVYDDKKVSGTSATTSAAPSIRAGVRWETGRWQVAALGSAEQVAVKFSGATKVTYDQNITGVKRTETPATFSLSVGRRF